MERVHERLADFEQTDPDELRKTDSEHPTAAVLLLGSTAHESVGILIDDRNAERAISGVIDYEALRPFGEATHVPDDQLASGGEPRRQRSGDVDASYPDDPIAAAPECESVEHRFSRGSRNVGSV